jgi:hypothetical protein
MTAEEVNEDMARPLYVYFFSQEKSKNLQNMQKAISSSPSERLLISFVHEAGLSNQMANKLIGIVKHPDFDKETISHSDVAYKTLIGCIHRNLPQEFSYERFELYVGALYGCHIRVDDSIGRPVLGCARNFAKALFSQYADVIFKGRMSLHPKPKFATTEDGRRIRVYSCWEDCKCPLTSKLLFLICVLGAALHHWSAQPAVPARSLQQLYNCNSVSQCPCTLFVYI